MILGNFLKYLFFPYINYLKIILPEHSIDYAWFEQELLLTLWLILMRFFLQNVLKSKPICIITDLYHFLIRHTYFSLSQNTYPSFQLFHSASGKGKDYCWCLGLLNSWALKNCYGGGEHLFSHFCLHSRIFQPCYLTFWDKAPKAKGSVPLHPLLSPL